MYVDVISKIARWCSMKNKYLFLLIIHLLFSGDVIFGGVCSRTYSICVCEWMDGWNRALNEVMRETEFIQSSKL